MDLFQNSSFLYFQSVFENEYLYGLNEFEAIGDASQTSLIESEIDFLSENFNLLVLYAESLTNKSEELFNDYGFVIDAKELYLFVSAVRQQVIISINHLIIQHSSSKIETRLSKVFRKLSKDLRTVFDKEFVKIRSAVNNDEDALECWDAYKVPIFELGFDIVSGFKLGALNEADNLMRKLDETRQDVAFAINQTIADLSMTPSTMMFPARSRVNTYVSLIINSN